MRTTIERCAIDAKIAGAHACCHRHSYRAESRQGERAHRLLLLALPLPQPSLLRPSLARLPAAPLLRTPRPSRPLSLRRPLRRLSLELHLASRIWLA